jgi:hypothetical protein
MLADRATVKKLLARNPPFYSHTSKAFIALEKHLRSEFRLVIILNRGGARALEE